LAFRLKVSIPERADGLRVMLPEAIEQLTEPIAFGFPPAFLAEATSDTPSRTRPATRATPKALAHALRATAYPRTAQQVCCRLLLGVLLSPSDVTTVIGGRHWWRHEGLFWCLATVVGVLTV
jgi:hypothetical protein